MEMPAHLFIVHFPIALVYAAVATDLVGIARGSQSVRRLGGYLLIVGCLTAFLGFFTGGGALSSYLLAHRTANPAVETHAQWGGAGIWLVGGAGMMRLMWSTRLAGVYGWINLGVALAAAVVITAITLTGTAIRHLV